MKINKFFLSAIEATVVVLILLSAEDLNIPNFINTILNLGSYLAVFTLIITTKINRVAYVITKDKILLLLVGLAFASLLWSEAPFVTLNQLRGLFRITLFGAYLATRYTLEEQVRLLTWTLSLAAILSLIICIALPSYGISFTNNATTWQGIYTHKQYLGRILVFGSSVFIANILGKKNLPWLMLPLLSLALGLIILSNSKTSLVVLALVILLLPLYRIAKQKAEIRLFIIFIILLFTTINILLFVSNIETIVVDILGKDLEFNGRMPIWNLAMEKALERPWLGYGYAAFWFSDAGTYVIKNTWASLIDTSNGFTSHNGYLEMVLQLGLTGLLVVVYHVVNFTSRIIKLLVLNKSIEFFWSLQFIAIIIAASVTGSSIFLSASNIFWIIYVSISLSSAVEYSRFIQNRNLATFSREAKISA